ncbi:MAG: Holliday junction resolvase RuvX [Alphaproteobacteria bacterium]|nr:Holliday junction resolvase RuvX [Alphaproteobacteria bacterium]
MIPKPPPHEMSKRSDGSTTLHHFPAHFHIEHLAKTVSEGPFLGIDWGKSRVGIALSDPDNTLSMPLSIVSTGGALRGALSQLWKDYAIKAIVMGWPMHHTGEPSALCAPILRLATRLHHDHGWPIALYDERLTTQGVAAYLHQPKAVIDDHAAALMLQGAIFRWKTITSPPCPYTAIRPSPL